MKILLVASEVFPFAKTGGLADVAGSLPKALAKMPKLDIRVVMPRYKDISGAYYKTDFALEFGDHIDNCIIKEDFIKAGRRKVPIYFVESYRFFDRDGLYGDSAGDYPDNALRYKYFVQATIEMLKHIDYQPDVIHCNDWQTALLPMLIKTKYGEDPFYEKMATVFTIHNLQYQGLFDPWVLNAIGLDWSYFTTDTLEFFGKVNLMKAGILYSDMINTVSVQYSREIQTQQYGERLEGLLQTMSGKITGIVNGIDTDEWNPEKDKEIKSKFNSNRLIDKKADNKTDLQKICKLKASKDTPLIGIVSRLVDQKGLDLIAFIADELLNEKVQLAVLGTGDPHYHQLLNDLQQRYPDKVSVHLKYDNLMAKKIYAGSDFFLMPSRFEPCGLGQLISMRYGTIPIVRATGGLEDTIVEFNLDKKTGNGFKFYPYEASELLSCIKRALAVYKQKESFSALIKNAMKSDHSWEASAKKYVELYQEALTRSQNADLKQAVTLCQS